MSRDHPDGGVGGNLTGDYVVGQVSGSLFQGRRPSRDRAARLASLFSSSEPPLQPVYVPVPKVSPRVLSGAAVCLLGLASRAGQVKSRFLV